MPQFGELEFINMTNQSAEEKRERISKIRAVMMKNSHRERRLAKENGHDISPPKTPRTSPPVHQHKYRRPKSEGCSKGARQQPNSATVKSNRASMDAISAKIGDNYTFADLRQFELSNGMPMETLCRASVLEPTPELLHMFEHWLNTHMSIAGAIEGHIICDSFMPFCRQKGTLASKVIVSSMIYSVLTFDDIINDRPFGPIVSHQYSLLINLLNEALRQPATAIQYPIISAVNGVMANNFLRGHNMEEFDIHYKGLKKIFELRGGLDDNLDGRVTKMSLSLLQALRRLDTIFSHNSNIPSRYTSITRYSNPNDASSTYRLFTLGTSKHSRSLQSQSQRLTHILTNLRRLARLAQIMDENQYHETQYDQAARQWDILKNQIFSADWYLAEQDFHLEYTQAEHILRACCAAEFILLAIADPNVLPITPPASNDAYQPEQTLIHLLLNLRHHINATNLNDFWMPLPGAQLWCLIIGCIASTRLGDAIPRTMSWFRMRLLQVSVAFWFAKGEPGQAVIESFEVIESGVRAASNLATARGGNEDLVADEFLTWEPMQYESDPGFTPPYTERFSSPWSSRSGSLHPMDCLG